MTKQVKSPELPEEVILYWSPGSISTLGVADELYMTELSHRKYIREDLVKERTDGK